MPLSIDSNGLGLTDPWILLDGRLHAPGIAPQLPNLFNQLTPLNGGIPVKRPPWKVAGVDYGVGIQAGKNLIVPNLGNIPTGMSIDGSNNVTFVGNGGAPIIFDGYDITSMNDLVVSGTCTGDLTVSNCKAALNSVKCGSPGTDVSFTVKYCQLEGLHPSPSGDAAIRSFAKRGTTIMFNSIRQADQGIFLVPPCTIKYNLITEVEWSVGGHANGIYLSLGQGPTPETFSDIQFNTFWTGSSRNSSGLPEGLGEVCTAMADNLPGPNNGYNNNWGYNSIVTQLNSSSGGTGGFSAEGGAFAVLAFFVDSGSTVFNSCIHENFIWSINGEDPNAGGSTGCSSIYRDPDNHVAVSHIFCSYFGNVNMADGGHLMPKLGGGNEDMNAGPNL